MSLNDSLVISTGLAAGTPGAVSSAIGSATSSYQGGQTVTQTLVLAPGQQFASPVGFSAISIATNNPVQLIGARGSNPTYINVAVNQSLTVDDSVDSFIISNTSTTLTAGVNVTFVVNATALTNLPGIVMTLNGQAGVVHILPGTGITIDNTVAPITIANDGVLTVNGKKGVVVVQALDNNNGSGLSLVSDSGATTGNLKFNRIVAGPKVTIAPDVNGNLVIDAPAEPYVLPAATNVVLGGVKQGANVTIAGDGTISVGAPYVLPASASSILGGVKVGSGLNVTLDGTLSVDFSNDVQSVNGVTPDVNGNVILTIPAAYVLPVATASVLGGVKQGANVTIAGDGTISIADPTTPYTLPVSTDVLLGGVKIGANVNVTGDGTISVAAPYTLPVATTSVLGGVKQGANVTIAGDGTISIPTPLPQYVLPVATTTVLGGVKQGANVTIAGDGTLSVATPYVLPVATASVLGGVKQGANVTIAGDGTISIPTPLPQYVLPVATSSVLGGVKQGSGVAIAGDGTISVTPYSLPVATALVLGGVKQGSGVTIAGDGTLNAIANTYVLPAATTSVLGGVKQGTGVLIASDGTLSAPIYVRSVVSVTGVPSGVSLINDDGSSSHQAVIRELVAGLNVTLVQTPTSVTINAQPPQVGLTAVNTEGTGIALVDNTGSTSGIAVIKSVLPGTNITIVPSSDGKTLTINSSNAAPVTSVNGKTGIVVLTATDLLLANVATSGSYNDLIDTPAPYALPIASATVLGGIKVGANLSIDGSGVLSAAAAPYTLPVATTTILGGVKQGTNVTIAGDGTISVAAPAVYTLPVATASVLGGVKQGSGVAITGDGTLSVTPYSLPVATALVLGGVKIGANITVAGDGTISVPAPSTYTLPVATTTVLGGVMQGANVTIAGDGTISVAAPYVLPVASATVLGGVKQGANVTIAGDGTISVAAPSSYTLPVATASVLGGVKQGSGVTIAGDGTLSVAQYSLPTASATVLGGIKVGTGLAIDGSGVLSATGTAPVTSVSGQTGVVVIQAEDNNAVTGTSLIVDGGSTTGVVKLKTLVQGANITLAADGNGNLTITAAAGTTYTLPVATASVLGGVKQGSNVTIAGDGTISVAAPTTPYTLPVATASVLGGVKQGAGVAIAGDGTISVTATGGVTTFNTRAGAVVLLATDVSGVGGALVGATNTYTGANSFTGGSITVPTQTATDVSTNAASTAFVHAVINAGIVTGIPANGNGFVDGILEQWNVNTTFSLTAGQTLYTADMWMNYSGLSGAATVSRQQYAAGQNTAGSVEPPKYFMRHSQTSAATDNPFIQQKLESARKYAGQSATFSVCLTAAAATTITGVNVIQNFGTGGSPSASVTTSVPVTWSVTTTEQRFSVRVDVPSVASKTFGVQFSDTLTVQLVLPSGQTFIVDSGMWQIEPASPTSSSNTTGTGGAPSAFNYLGYAQEQTRIRRYIAYVTCTGIVATGIAASTAVAYGPSQRFPVPMLKSPAITITGVSYFDTAAPGGTGTATGTGINLEEYYLQINAAGRTTWTAGYFGVSTAGTLLFDARP